MYFANFPTPGVFISGELCIHHASSAEGTEWTYKGIVIYATEPWEKPRVGDPDLVDLGSGCYRMYYYSMEDYNSDIVSAIYQ